jgi:DNA repair protein RecN (Recombination protein N)
MLVSVYLKNFVIVNEAELVLSPGMTAITGETGAGKSILVDALNLVLGDRVTGDVIRAGEDKAEINATFDLSACPTALAWLQDQELDEDDECIIRRVISRNSSGRGFINGRPVIMQQLRQLGDLLVDIHGQHEHQSLLRSASQREILDSIAGHHKDMEMLAKHYAALQQLQQQLDQLYSMAGRDESQTDLLRYQVSELENLDLQADELGQLEEEHKRLANASDLITGASESLDMLSGDQETNIDEQLNRTVTRLQQLERLDPSLDEVTRILLEADTLIDEVANRIRQYIDRIDTDQERLAGLNQRIGAIHDLARKHRVVADELPSLLQKLQRQLLDVENSEQRIIDLQGEIESTRQKYMEQAAIVSQRRSKTAKALSAEVTRRMQDLGMEGGKFSIEVSSTASQEPRRHGLDEISYLVAANPGQQLKPLSRVASGGELSRIALALQVSVMESVSTPTLIFDEIDVGIGGRVAEIVGRELARLGTARQVICITHLAQVAANAGAQVQISKSGDPVTARIKRLSESERVEEIARMMGGVEITEQTLAHAEEMLGSGS